MIYVMRSAGFDENNNFTTLIKIGYTGENSKKSRFSLYLTENPTIKTLYLIDGGDEQDERNLHRYFKHLKTDYGREWFMDSFEIIEFFNNHKTKESLKGLEGLGLSKSQKRKSSENRRDNKDKIPLINISVKSILKGELDRNRIKELENYLWYRLDDFWEVIGEEFSEYEEEIKRGIEGIESVSAVYCDEGGSITNDLQNVYDHLISEFDKDNNFVRRMKLLCDIYFQYPTFYIQYANSPLQCIIPIEYQNYINLLGFEKIKALKYQEADILSHLSSLGNLQSNPITSLFTIGSKYSKAQIKEMLREFYTTNNITKTPKASDLEEYYNLRECQFMENGKKVHGFEIISKKEGVD